MRTALFLVFLLSLPLLAVAENSTQKIGALLILSGEYQSVGKILADGVKAADTGNIELVYEDTQCEVKHGISAYRRLADLKGLKFFVGPICTSVQNSLAPLLKGKEQIMLSLISTSEKMIDSSDGNIFVSQYTTEDEARFNASEIYKRGLKRAVIAYLDNDFSRFHEEAFRDAYQGTIVKAFRYPSYDPTHIKDLALKLRTIDFDVLYLPDSTSLVLGLLTQMHKLGIKDKAVFSIFSAEQPDVIKNEGRFADGLFYSYPDTKGEDVLYYFPRKATEILSEAVSYCSGKYQCVKSRLREKHGFDKRGVKAYKIVLKTIKNGEFKPAQ